MTIIRTLAIAVAGTVIKALIVLGEGIAWLPDYLTADAAEAGKLVRVLSQWRPKQQQFGTLYFIYAGRRYALPKVEAFIQTALEVGLAG